MSRKHKILDPAKPYFVTLTVAGWADVFVRTNYRDVLIKSFEHCASQKGLEIFAFCIMTSHVHMIVGSHGDPLQDILRDLTRYTALELHKIIETNPEESRKSWLVQMFHGNGRFQFWQHGNHPVELFSPAVIDQKLQYIHNNPVEAGFVNRAEDYLYSSARNYFDKPGVMEVTLLLLQP